MTDGVNQWWYEISPAEAADLDLSVRLDIGAPLNEQGERCPWPWEPQQRVGVPLGQYHCGYCGAMCIAGIRHLDYREMISDESSMPPLPTGHPDNREHRNFLVLGELPQSPDERSR